jgi:hypothetical protein
VATSDRAAPDGFGVSTGEGRGDLLPRLVAAEVSLNVAMPLDDVDDLEVLRPVAEENHVAFVGHAADLRVQFGPASAECAGKRGKLRAPAAKLRGEPPAGGRGAALAGDVFEDGDEVAPGCREIDEPRHSAPLCGELGSLGLDRGGDVVVRVAAAFGD